MRPEYAQRPEERLGAGVCVLLDGVEPAAPLDDVLDVRRFVSWNHDEPVRVVAHMRVLGERQLQRQLAFTRRALAHEPNRLVRRKPPQELVAPLKRVLVHVAEECLVLRHPTVAQRAHPRRIAPPCRQTGDRAQQSSQDVRHSPRRRRAPRLQASTPPAAAGAWGAPRLGLPKRRF
jgi:hypothetical protein